MRTFDEICNDLKIIETFKNDRETDRTVYSYKGIEFFTDLTMPYNPFKKQSLGGIITGLLLEREKFPETDLTTLYSAETHGHPHFSGKNTVEKIAEFIDNYLS